VIVLLTHPSVCPVADTTARSASWAHGASDGEPA
jgi:hypothetical protein